MIITRRQFSVSAASLAAVAAAPAMAQVAGKLVLYTSQPDKDAQQTIAGFRKLHPGVEVEVFRSGTTEVMAKLAAEIAAGQPRPDLLFIADAASMEQLKADNRLEAYREAKVDGIPEGLIDKDRTYFGTKVISTGIVYNRAAPE
jgi:iron(III) transport system substrate-binding protein